MKYVKETTTNEIVINKSRFIAHLIPINDVDEATEQLKEIKKQHYNATHNCYAYVLDNHMTQKMNDDGEPTRTAGFPILETLTQNKIDNVLCVVTRYFGGTKLGKGGLIRAYKNATSEVIKKASFYKEETKQVYNVEIPYNLYESFNFIIKEKAFIISEDFKENITINFYLNEGSINELYDKFNGQTIFNELEVITVKVPHQ